MAKRTGPSNMQLRFLIAELRKIASKQNIKLWKRIADELERPSRQRRAVNISRINHNVRKGEIALVPGKVLSSGELDKDITVAAWKFSDQARKKIKNAMTIEELMKKNPQGKKVRIIG